MTLQRILLIVALVLAIVATLVGFDILSTDQDTLAWVAASLACFYASHL